MLEFFAVTSVVEKTKKENEKETQKIKELFDNEDIVSTSKLNTNALGFVIGIVAIVISLYTAKLALECNKKSDDVVQVLAVLFAFFFSGTYLLYYFIWHTILKNKC